MLIIKPRLSILVILSFTSCVCFSQTKQIKEPGVGAGWFDEMITTISKTSDQQWKKELNAKWQDLRGRYKDPQSLMEMSWEERDKIWLPASPQNIYSTLAGRYRLAYNVSSNERGLSPQAIDTTLNNLASLKKLRQIYLQSRKAEYVILTPKAPKEPRINASSVYGVRPGNELIYRIATTGERPIKFSVKGLPIGCTLNTETGVINGKISSPGSYTLTFFAQNKYGRAQKEMLLKVGNEIALTPPLGWNSWNSFACDVTATDIRNTAGQLIKTGLANFGWSYINIDDCWMNKPDVDKLSGRDKEIREVFYNRKNQARINNNKVRFDENKMIGTTRDAHGSILSNSDFPDMKSLTNYIHSLGMKAGIYTSPGPLTCQCYEGSYEHELDDARQFANWGFDYLKYDWCGYSGLSKGETVQESKAPYELMGKALKQVDRDMLYSLCQYGKNDVWRWGKEIGGNCWRTTSDIRDTWESVVNIGFKQAGLEAYAGPGHWNDPDMLVVGYVGWNKNLRPTYLSPNEQYTHITLWSMLAAPLLIGCDLTRLDDFTYGLLSNAEVIAVNQDALGKQASQVIETGDIKVWTKPLSDGSVAVGVFNVGETPAKFDLQLSALKLTGKYKVRDLWKQQDVNTTSSSVTVPLNRHAVKLFKLTKINS